MSEETFDLDLQQKIVALMAQDAIFLSQAHDHVKPFYFDSEVLVDLSRILVDFFRKYRTNPPQHILERLVTELLKKHKRLDKDVYYNTVDELYADSLPERDYIADVVFEFIQFQALRNVFLDGVDLLQRKDFDKIRQLMDKALSVSRNRNVGLDYFDPDSMEARIHFQEASKVSTNLPELDKYLGGGLGAGELGIMLGAPNSGKSIMLTILGAGAVRLRKKVLHISMEMSDHKVALRYDMNLMRMSKQALKDRAIAEIQEQLLLIQRTHKSNLHIKQWPTRGATVGDIKAYIEYMKTNKFSPDLLLVDYAAIMKPTSQREGRHQEIEEVNEELRGLGGELMLPVWTVAQTNRTGVNKPVLTIEDLGESFAQSKVADVIPAICQTKKEYDEKVMRLYLAKNRDDTKFASIRYRISYDTMSIKYEPDVTQPS